MNAPIAEFSDYDGLRRALNAVRDHRKVSLRVMNDVSGAPDGYFEKVLGPRPARRIGLQSLGWALQGLGVKCVLVEDPEAWARVPKSRLEERDEAHFRSVHSGAVIVQINRGFLRKIGAIGGANSRKNLGKRKRRQLAKKAVMARINKRKAAEMKKRARQRQQTHKSRKAGNET